MFKHLGAIVSRHWVVVLLLWAALVVGIRHVAPRWDDVTLDGDFAYLPDRMTSVRGEKLLAAAFPEGLSKSQVVLIVARSDGPLQASDFALTDRLLQEFTPKEGEESPIVSVWSYQTEVFGDKFISRVGPQGQAMLTLLQLRTEFMAIGNMPLLKSICDKLAAIRREKDFPAGLELGVSGSAAFGADMLFSAEESIRNTERTTIGLVILILLLVYRAPGLVVVPLATIVTSVTVSVSLVAILAGASAQTGWFDFKVFKTTEIFIIVILFGAGTDFCLFLISRYREEIQRGLSPPEAISYALAQVGSALAGSAMTTIFGLGMMFFADFGKLRNGGPAIALCLVVALVACVTLAPALLRATGLWVFWPFGVGPRQSTLASRQEGPEEVVSTTLRGGFWDWLSRAIIARPGTILLVSILVMAPAAYKGLSITTSYDLVAELRASCPSVQGTKLLRRYFSIGQTGPVTVLAFQDKANFDAPEGRNQIARLTKYLYDLTYTGPDGVATRPILSVLSLTEPLGSPPGSFNPLSTAGRKKLAVLRNPRTRAVYLSQAPHFANRVTRFDLIFGYDPFSRESVQVLNYVEKQLLALAEDRSSPWYGASFDLVGTTAGIRDLEAVMTSDESRIQRLVVIAVLAVLLLILRHPVICLFLIWSVLFSYFVTIGLTELFFSWLYGGTFHGLDWKVPIFLFVILIAIGQDYNIYLATRVLEEQSRLGPWAGLHRALVHTGGIITSCGVIMAGTFVSMVTGTLRGMHELGFSLSFGVLLDTLVIRTILVPAFLALWQRRAQWRLWPARPSQPSSEPIQPLAVQNPASHSESSRHQRTAS